MENHIYLIFLFILVNSKDILYNHTNEENNLYFVFTTFRHGARTSLYKNDYFGRLKKSPGVLTKYGALQHLKIGNNYRERYSNFLNMSFDKSQMYIRSSKSERVIVSTEYELLGLFNKSISRKNIHLIQNGYDFRNLYNFDDEEKNKLNKYFNYCKKKKRILSDYMQLFNSEIFPILKEFYGAQKTPKLYFFCDSVIPNYVEYIYGNDTDNMIGKCGKENATKMYNFCFEYFNTFRGWNEYAGYMLYMLYQHIFDYMNNYINGLSPLKMVMVGGHEITIDRFIDFLDGLKIINRNEYPHFAYNIVLELRKYNNVFYVEFYYNDTLRYNNTLKKFKDILNNSKYSNLYSYCGIPPWIEKDINKTIGKENNKFTIGIISNLKRLKSLNVYIIIGSILFIIIIFLTFIILDIYKKTKKQFMKLSEDNNSKNISGIKNTLKTKNNFLP